MIEKFKEENIKVGIVSIIITLAMLYSLIFSFDSYVWLLLGFIAWCCFTYIKGNLRAIKFYENQREKYERQEKQSIGVMK